uniref:Recombinase family protein n=1 Tax=Phenylobacterium glaciei TaxID=2803784 RepID=A0A974P534_9CAUL|nr:recombinase family protein [Phenylobacterium glaciei]
MGYDAAERTLKINQPEATIVRQIFERYLELGSVNTLARELEQQGVRSKAWVSLEGKPMGGRAISRGSLFHLLRNRLYRGEIVHKDKVFPAFIPDRACRTVRRGGRDAGPEPPPASRAADARWDVRTHRPDL